MTITARRLRQPPQRRRKRAAAGRAVARRGQADTPRGRGAAGHANSGGRAALGMVFSGSNALVFSFSP